jgi:hypothetical protein
MPTTTTPERRRAQRRESAAKSKAMTVPCPVCDAQVGEPCDTELSRARVIHLTRYADVLIAAMGAKP